MRRRWRREEEEQDEVKEEKDEYNEFSAGADAFRTWKQLNFLSY